MKPIRLIRSIFTVGIWTMASRVLGVLREVLILALIGPGPVLDAFVAAFRLPNMFRRFFAEGAFNTAFVPIFSKKLEAGDDANGFASDALAGLAMILLALCAVAMVFMPAFIWASAEGFAGTARFDLAVNYGRIAFPYIFFISLAALFSGALNAMGHFAAAAAAPVLLNILVCVALVAAWGLGGDVALWLIWSVPVAGMLQLALVWRAAYRAGLSVKMRLPRLTPDMRRLIQVALPAMLAGGVVQINLLVGQQVASGFERAVSWLYAADRLYQLPLGVVGIAVGVVLLPSLSRSLKAGDDAGGRDALNRGAELALALTLPAAVALVVIPDTLVSVLFERGAMRPSDTAAIATAVWIYGLGLPAFVLQKLLQPIFFAREDTRFPFRAAVYAMILNAVMAIGLAPVIGWIAPAIATTTAAWAMVVILAFGARRFGPVVTMDSRLTRRLPRICLSAGVMGIGLSWVDAAAAQWLALPYWRLAALGGLILFGIALYALAAHITGAMPLQDLRAAIQRRKNA
jgi:putative peptidoglycan lipid II flippase